jgi:NAD+ kinase
MAACIGIFGHGGKPGVLDALTALVRSFAGHPVTLIVESDLAAALLTTLGGAGYETAARDSIVRTTDLIVAFGGDGTLLAAAREALGTPTPILGINVGKLGFLADVNADEAHTVVEDILRGSYRIEERMTLTGTATPDAEPFHALNDIVVSKAGIARVIKIRAFVDDEFLATFYADGIILATPTGSTAYSLATGGPIVVPTSEVMVISPISAHALTTRPIIVPSQVRIRLEAQADEGELMVMADGQAIRRHASSARLEVTRGRYTVHLVKRFGVSYFDMLRRKLSWGQDTRFTHPADAIPRDTPL